MKNKLNMIFSVDMLQSVIDIIFKYIPVVLFSALFPCKEKDLWLISERKGEAKDNGYHLFRYIVETHPEQRIVYAIAFNCKDYNKVKVVGECVKWGSYKHFYYYVNASKHLSTDFTLCAPTTYIRLIILHTLPFLKPKAKVVFLQHGITKDRLKHAFKNKTQANLFICGAWPEYEYIKANFGYADSEVAYTGFARFDNLFDYKVKRQILYMPTWRSWMQLSSRNSEKEREKFVHSIKYRMYESVLTSESLQQILQKNNCELLFYPHPRLQKYVDSFRSCIPNIKVLSSKQVELQEVMKESAALITDYSSVFFDFAYMHKPMVYFQFDYEEYRKNQYAEGYFSYTKNGFGSVVSTIDEMILQVEKLFENNLELQAEYKKSADTFFRYRDTDNCKRNYEAIRKLR